MSRKTLNFSHILIFLLLTINFFSVHAGSTGEMPESSHSSESLKLLKQQLSGILSNSILKRGNVGVGIYDLTSGSPLYEFNADTSLIPASNMKIFTTAAALGILGPEYTFSTDIYIAGNLSGSSLDGDIIIVGQGDPWIVKENLWLLAQDFADTGITSVTGCIVLDTSFFDDNPVPDPDWHRIKMPLRYNAPTSALSFNFNAIAVWVSPGKQPGAPAVVKIDPPSDYFVFNNQAVTGKARSRNTLVLAISKTNGKCTLLLKGSIPSDYKKTAYYRHVTEPEYYLGETFKHYLKQCGVNVSGGVQKGALPKHAEKIVSHDSKSLSALLTDANKYSNNLMIEQTLKTIGAVEFKSSGSTILGAKAVKNFFIEHGIDLTGFQMSDGSGLSRNNKATARQLASIFRLVLTQSTFGPEFMTALPVAGVDGTLKKRLKHDSRNRLVRGKTGLVQGVSCLSGVIDSRNGKGIVFSILFNDIGTHYTQAKQLQDKIVKALLDYWLPEY
ncbi:D-alanyl-D-alanine carboxypeptidase/D-alanyl-D-alanine-endopeptidase [bacterium]|nr:D-alanyl-D-alanine carboxypeptidase/D-alanyl-D-alanine-endopeptidase [candidate division CSSED10-310 bacterium]